MEREQPPKRNEMPTNPSMGKAYVDIPVEKAEEVATLLRHKVIQLMTPGDTTQADAFSEMIIGVLRDKKLDKMELFISIGGKDSENQRILADVNHIINPPNVSGEHAIKFETVRPERRSLIVPKSEPNWDGDIDDAINFDEI